MSGSAAPSSPPAKSLSPAKSPAKSPSPTKSPASPAATSSPLAALSPGATEADVLVADENPEEDHLDLGIDLGAGSDTASLRSSILKYREENGRTYHAYKDGSYVLPNDDAENERLDLQHTIFLLTFDSRLHAVKLDRLPRRVLDAGCGTGIWGIEFADENPNSEVTGVDLSPIQPPFVPPNVRFFIDDVEDDWNYSTPFDFVFARFLTGSIKDWPRFFKQSYDNLAPGGAIEMQDCIHPFLSDDGTLVSGSYLDRWTRLILSSFAGTGRDIDSALRYEQQLIDAGFVDVTVVREKWPTNRWPRDKKYKQIGIWNVENFSDALGAMTLALFTRPKSENGLGWTRKEVEMFLMGVRRDMRDTNIHAYIPIYSVHARKPGTAV